MAVWAPSLALGVILAAVGLGGCAWTPPAFPDLSRDDACAQGGIVAVVDRGWHTDIALPVTALSGPMAALIPPGARFLVFGFGDRAYFMAREETALGTMAALFPGPGVILVTALAAPPSQAFGADHVVELAIPRPCGVVAFVARAITRNGDGAPSRLGDGPYPGSIFYASGDRYDAFHNCNGWTAAALQSAGLAVDSTGVLFAGQVMTQARRLAEQQGLNNNAPEPALRGVAW